MKHGHELITEEGTGFTDRELPWAVRAKQKRIDRLVTLAKQRHIKPDDENALGRLVNEQYPVSTQTTSHYIKIIKKILQDGHQ